jgi:glycosyltransferase involved in cell wall biosynthesis
MKKPQPIYLSVIIPAYNEAGNFAKKGIFQVYDYLKAADYSWELLIINDGSSDNTLKLITDFAKTRPEVHVIDNPHQGKAATIISGALKSHGRIVLFSDMDQATPINEVEKFLPLFDQGYNVVIGSRSGRKGAPLFRRVLAYGMVVVRTLLLNLPYRDTQCGFKAFDRLAADKLFGLMEKIHPPIVIAGPAVNPGFDVELLYLSRKLGLRTAEVPVTWLHQDSKRVSFFKDAVNGLHELLLIRFRSLTGGYHL